MTTCMNRLAFALLPATLFAAAATAQEPIPTRAQVDVLIFRHVAASPEQADNIARASPQHGGDVYTGVNPFSTETGVTENNVSPLSESASRLNKEAQRITRAEDFELLQQISWNQPVHDPQNAFHVSLLPARRGGLLKGTAKLSFERYFQLEITLLYEPGFAASEPVEQDSPEIETVLIKLKEVMTDNKLYYLDYPLLGVLAQITVLETETPETSN